MSRCAHPGHRATRAVAVLALAIALAHTMPALGTEGTVAHDGNEWGFVMYDGTVMTPSRYDEVFGYESLLTVESQVFPGRSVAEVYGLEPTTPASERVLGGGFGPTFTFRSLLGPLAI